MSNSLKWTATGTNPNEAGYHIINPCYMSKSSQLTAVTVAAKAAPGGTVGADFGRLNKLVKRCSKDILGIN